jgi:hypothetical protein
MIRLRSIAAVIATPILLSSAACTSSHKLDENARIATTAPENIAWGAARREDVIGYFESERITGEAAASLRKIYYSFASDGTYAGAALVQDAGKSTFQVLSGKWTLTGPTIKLGDDGAPTKIFAAPDRLRLDSDGGSVTLRRGKTE